MKIKFTNLISFFLVICLYILLIVYIRDFDLLNKTIFGDYELGYKLKILSGSILSLPYSLTKFQLSALFIIAFLTSLNIILLAKRIWLLKSNGKIKFLTGGGMLLGIGTTGCAVCGLPFLAFLGLGSSVVFLPFEGAEFSILTILMLMISTNIILKDINRPLSCAPKLRFKSKRQK